MEERCPVCHRAVIASVQEESGLVEVLPFCSRRCKLRDLGAWLDAEYRIVSGSNVAESAELLDDDTPSFDTE